MIRKAHHLHSIVNFYQNITHYFLSCLVFVFTDCYYADYIVQISGMLPPNDYWILLYGNDGKTSAHKLTLTQQHRNVNVR